MNAFRLEMQGIFASPSFGYGGISVKLALLDSAWGFIHYDGVKVFLDRPPLWYPKVVPIEVENLRKGEISLARGLAKVGRR